ncbi:MAG: transcriptional repressor [Phycisphaerales bacterium]|nr:MAG: transcriptional repressor [Phycisphaerales bacterium]
MRATQRNTRQREVVLEELRRLGTHPTAAELYEIARARLPKISLGTVYRNLELLAENGIIQKLKISGAEARFDGDPQRHYHVCCVRCGRVDDVHDLPRNFVRRRAKQLSGYDILGFRLEFNGICPECKKRSAPGSDEGASQEKDRAV